MIRALGLYLLASLLVVGAAAWVLILVYPGAAGQQAVLTSAVIALVVQLAAFVILRAFKGRNVMAGWGLGALLRFGTLGAYALVIIKALGLDAGAALISMAAFLFLSMIIEPLLVNV
jgi:hypothetical protein